ncbi:MAG: hypothetical protein ACI9DC_005338, partial [Gammaproteobacteria bacterium]
DETDTRPSRIDVSELKVRGVAFTDGNDAVVHGIPAEPHSLLQ